MCLSFLRDFNKFFNKYHFTSGSMFYIFDKKCSTMREICTRGTPLAPRQLAFLNCGLFYDRGLNGRSSIHVFCNLLFSIVVFKYNCTLLLHIPVVLCDRKFIHDFIPSPSSLVSFFCGERFSWSTFSISISTFLHLCIYAVLRFCHPGELLSCISI